MGKSNRPKQTRRESIEQTDREASERMCKQLSTVTGSRHEFTSYDGPRLSEMLLEMMGADFQEALNRGDMREARRVISLSVLAWNLALMPDGSRSKHLASFAKTLVQSTPESEHEATLQDFSYLMRELIQRKLIMFPNARRFILSFDYVPLSDGSGDYRLNVISAPHSSELDADTP